MWEDSCESSISKTLVYVGKVSVRFFAGLNKHTIAMQKWGKVEQNPDIFLLNMFIN